MSGAGAAGGRTAALDLLLALGLALAAAALRVVAWDEVFEGGRTWIFPGDPAYHLRRALLTLAEWPHVPAADPFVNFPEGAPIKWPPGLAWLLAGATRLSGAGAGPDRLELVASLIPPLVGGITVGVFFLSARFLGRGAALWAAVILALMPGFVQYTVISRYDHHMLEPLLCWGILRSAAAAAGAGTPRGYWLGVIGGALCIGLSMLTWPGVLLHLGLCLGAVLLAAVVLRRPGREHRVTRSPIALRKCLIT